LALLLALVSARPSVAGMESAFDCAWTAARDHIHDERRARTWFSDSARLALRARAERARDADELATILNPFLDALNVSHTTLMTDSDLAFYLHRGTYAIDSVDFLAVAHIGVQGDFVPDGFLVRNTFEGFPADRAGLRRGDVLVSIDGRRFRPFGGFEAERPAVLSLRRNGRSMVVTVTPVLRSVQRSMLEAMRNSVRRVEVDGRRVGILHLWTLLYPTIQKAFTEIVVDSLADCDGIVLDLRDGFGGWWLPYADAFFADRSGYPVVRFERRSGASGVVRADSVPPHRWYSRPLVLIVNEGSRSGKEGLAWQLRKAGRARLVGTTTAGAFRGGELFRCQEEPRALLMVAGNMLWLDDVAIENTGVAPDVRVEHPARSSLPGDPQLERALVELRSMMRPNPR
jgi:carboxyl-terminal processing protease